MDNHLGKPYSRLMTYGITSNEWPAICLSAAEMLLWENAPDSGCSIRDARTAVPAIPELTGSGSTTTAWRYLPPCSPCSHVISVADTTESVRTVGASSHDEARVRRAWVLSLGCELPMTVRCQSAPTAAGVSVCPCGRRSPAPELRRCSASGGCDRYVRPRAVQVGLLVAALALGGCTQTTVITSSMAPTIQSGTKVTVDWTAYSLSAPKRWDVVCFKPPMLADQIWAMRVVALPGETVSFATNGIAINGRSIALPIALTNVSYVSVDHPALRPGAPSLPSPYVVPSNSFFVLGDNSTIAFDSRFWGAVPRTNVFGKVRGL